MHFELCWISHDDEGELSVWNELDGNSLSPTVQM